MPAWGVGELYFRAGRLLYHELPRTGSSNADRAEHPLAERVLAYFRGERVTFDDVEIEEEWATPFQQAIAEALRARPVGRGRSPTASSPRSPAGRRAPRAAGTFCAENNFPLVVPCHRVVSCRPASAATARSASTTSAGSWRWRASSSEPLGGRSRRARRDRAAQGLLPARRALRPRPRRGQRPPARRRAHRRSISSWRAGRWRDGRSRSCARYGVPCEIRTYKRRVVRAGDPLPAPPRGRCPRRAGAERGRRPRREPRPARAAAAASGRALVLPSRLPARRVPRGGLGQRAAQRAPRAAHAPTVDGASSLPSLRPRRASPLAVYDAAATRSPTRRATRRDRRAARLPRRAGAPRSRSARRRSSRRRGPARTGWPTPTTRTSCARAAPPTSQLRAIRRLEREGRLDELAPELREIAASGSATRRSRCASSPAAAARRRRRRPPTAAWQDPAARRA